MVDPQFADLVAQLRSYGSCAVAFSGGVDSAFLLAAAHDALGEHAVAFTVITPFMPSWEADIARGIAVHLGARHQILTVPFPEEIRDNPPDRCYRCKRTLFRALQQHAASLGLAVVADGSNRDDLSDHRPGRRALAELGVRSPLLETGFTKADIRRCAKVLGLPHWDRPPLACLLTRLPHHRQVTDDLLDAVDAAERVLHDAGFPAVRVRSHDDIARIEVPVADIPRVAAPDTAAGIAKRLRALGYRHVTLDLAGYTTGSMNAPGRGSAPY